MGPEVGRGSERRRSACFAWRSKVSDHLDGTLEDEAKKAAEDHLRECRFCAEIDSHYRQIVETLGSLPRYQLPVQLRSAPLSARLPRLESQGKSTRWERTPWYFRTSVEGIGISAIILLVVVSVPKIREYYERSQERRLEAYALEDEGDEAERRAPPLARGKTQAEGVEEDIASGGDEAEDQTNEIEAADYESEAESRVAPSGGKADIWRFSVKTDSPHELRPRIIQALSELRIPRSTPGMGGVEAPGGIQFDLLVPQTAVPQLKTQLQRLAGSHRGSGHAGDKGESMENFTWYKTRASRPIPVGKARVVIWLSQN